MKRIYLIATWILLAFFFSLQSLHAATVHFSDFGITGKKGSYEAEITYAFLDDLQAILTVELTNTSNHPSTGFITALAFNNPNDQITGVVVNSTNDNFSLIGQADFRDGIAVSPYGSFDIGASIAGGTKDQWLGGKNPALGIGIGSTGIFTFTLSGTGLSALDEQSFLDTLSFPDQNKSASFAVRFRGNDNDMDTNPGPPVPLPPSVMLLGAGLLGLISLRKKSS
jgi:hypothetical protein